MVRYIWKRFLLWTLLEDQEFREVLLRKVEQLKMNNSRMP